MHCKNCDHGYSNTADMEAEIEDVLLFIVLFRRRIINTVTYFSILKPVTGAISTGSRFSPFITQAARHYKNAQNTPSLPLTWCLCKKKEKSFNTTAVCQQLQYLFYY